MNYIDFVSEFILYAFRLPLDVLLSNRSLTSCQASSHGPLLDLCCINASFCALCHRWYIWPHHLAWAARGVVAHLPAKIQQLLRFVSFNLLCRWHIAFAIWLGLLWCCDSTSTAGVRSGLTRSLCCWRSRGSHQRRCHRRHPHCQNGCAFVAACSQMLSISCCCWVCV